MTLFTKVMLSTMFSMWFALWPIFVIGFIGRARRNFAPRMFAGWVVCFIVWLATIILDLPRAFFVIPEPGNTVVFFLTGLILIAALIKKNVHSAT